jgi:asparagine synthase (glutamine-hydrolysing)
VHPGVDRTIDPVALEQYLSFDFVLSPRSIFKGIRKLPAGHIALVDSGSLKERRYWHLDFSSSDRGESEIIEKLDTLLDASVKERMVADVPVGLFLSGGLDSSTVGYYMSRHSSNVHSFSIGFEEDGYDESHFARTVADHLGMNHHLEIFSQDRVKEWIPRIPEILDEPMADQSILPTALLCLTTRKGVKVALGGDGSDEMLMGYNTYKAMAIADRIDVLPASLRRGLATAARAMPENVAGVRLRGLHFASRLDQTPARRLLSHLGALGGAGGSVLISPGDPSEFWDEAEVSLGSGPGHWSPAERTLSAYVNGYLQEDILVKVDRASMAASLEVRAPFLDTSVVEFLATVPVRLKLRGMQGKYILRRLMRGRLPDSILDRPKQGFGIPLNAWLGESLMPLVEDHLNPDSLARTEVFDSKVVGRLLQRHRDGHSEGQRIWPILLFQMWHQRWLSE